MMADMKNLVVFRVSLRKFEKEDMSFVFQEWLEHNTIEGRPEWTCTDFDHQFRYFIVCFSTPQDMLAFKEYLNTNDIEVAWTTNPMSKEDEENWGT